MGCGKSSVGKRLSELLCCRFMDLDEVIVGREGRSIPEIFAEDGEGEFRRMEKEALEDVLRDSGNGEPGQSLPSQAMGPSLCGQRGSTVRAHHSHCPSKSNSSILGEETLMVLALGGGAVMQEECEEMVHSGTLCIYLRASVKTLVERLTGESAGRPLLKTSALRTRILELMAARSETYERVAHIIIDTDGKSIDEVAEEIESFRRSPSTR